MNSKLFFDSVNEIFNEVQTPYTCREDFIINIGGVSVVYERWEDEDIINFQLNSKHYSENISQQSKKNLVLFYYRFYCITKPIFEHLKQTT